MPRRATRALRLHAHARRSARSGRRVGEDAALDGRSQQPGDRLTAARARDRETRHHRVAKRQMLRTRLPCAQLAVRGARAAAAIPLDRVERIGAECRHPAAGFAERFREDLGSGSRRVFHIALVAERDAVLTPKK